MSQRILASEAKDHIGESILIKGWVRIRRDHGKLIFLDIRDRSGIIQVVVNSNVSEEASIASRKSAK
jgi:aspartyl-tRNA synthetase